MDNINSILKVIDSWVWGPVLIILILFVGIYFSFRLKFFQIKYLPTALKFMLKDEDGSSGEVSSFAALCTTLSATIGTGNIVGVATAISIGGPGALFWMCLAAFFGMATKYAEGLLSVKYREIDKDNHVLGGAFYYIEKGMGKKFIWLAKIFAFFGAAVALTGIGTFAQANGIVGAISSIADPEGIHKISILGLNIPLVALISSLIISVLVALILVGGIKRISSISEVMVPFMAITYLLCCFIILISNITAIPEAFKEIFSYAFTGVAAVGGFAGAGVKDAIQKGVSRGIFSNEAGLGSSTMATAAAKTKWPARQGLVSMVAVFIDTLLICTLTGLSIIISGAWKVEGLHGVEITAYAFQSGFSFAPWLGQLLLVVCLVSFAFTTIIGWDYYGEQCLAYLLKDNKKAVSIYRWIYIVAVFIGGFLTVEVVWNISDIFNGLMALPNLIALLALSGVVVSESKKYFEYLKNEKKLKNNL